jgi:hypothetical protein
MTTRQSRTARILPGLMRNTSSATQRAGRYSANRMHGPSRGLSRIAVNTPAS